MSKKQRDEDELTHEQFISCSKSLSKLHRKWALSGYQPDTVMAACSESSARICIYLGATKEAYMKAMEDVFDSVKLDIEKQGKGN